MKIPKINFREDDMDSSVSASSSLSIINRQEGLNERIAENTDYAGKALVSYEEKINHIINICKMDSNYFSNLEAAIIGKRKSKDEMIMVNVFDSFRPKLDFSADESFKIARDRGCLEFEKGRQPVDDNSRAYHLANDSYNYGDDYYKQENYYLMLSLKLDKLLTSLGYTSHMGSALRNCAKGNRNGYLQMGVLGTLRMLDKYVFQVKPYAVWM